MGRKVILLVIVVVLIAGGIFLITRSPNKPEQVLSQTTTQTTTDSSDTSSDVFDKNAYSLTDPSSIWVIVNKKHAIPISFTPNLGVPAVRLRLAESEQQMQIDTKLDKPLQDMFAAAKKDDVELVFGSGYRSGVLQKQFYDSYVRKDGKEKADTYSARPGHSEHQTGLALDVTSASGKCHLTACFADMPEGKWLAAHAHEYGFIIRYPKNKQAITGYQYEPWHIRYVGEELASQLHTTKQTLEEFFNLEAAPTY